MKRTQIEAFNPHYIILGKSGCLSGDTLIRLNRAEIGFQKTLKYLYNQLNDNPEKIRMNRPWKKDIQTYVRSFNGEVVRLHKIDSVVYSGKKHVCKLKLENGYSLKLTPEHKVMTSEGWAELCTLTVGETMVMCDTPHARKKANPHQRTRNREFTMNCKNSFHPFIRKGIDLHRAIYEAHINNLTLTEYVEIINNNYAKADTLEYINPQKYVIHHKDGNHYNNDINNLQCMTKQEHYKHHGHKLVGNFGQGVPEYSRVKSIDYIGIEDTYDIICEHPHHNFNANDIIVHNSGKSNAAESILTNYLDYNRLGKEKFKCIDLYDSGRFENFCYTIKENRPDLCKTLHEAMSLPQSFKTEILMINGANVHNYSKLPNNVKIVSFDQSTLRVQDLFFLLGQTPRLYGLLTYISNMFGDDLTLRELYDLFTQKKLHGKPVHLDVPPQTRQMMIRNLRKWVTSGMFSNNCEKIDFKKMVNDTDTITSFCTACLEADEESIAYGIILKNLFEMKRKQKVKPTVKCYIREISNFLTTGSIDLGEKHFAQHYILRMLREGRDYGCEVIGDTQRGQDLPTKYRRQFGTTIQMKSDYADAEKLKDIQYIPDKYIHQVNRFGLGFGMILTGQDLQVPVRFRPCRHRHKKSKMDVLRVLGKKFGEYELDHDKLLKIDEKLGTNHTLDPSYKEQSKMIELEKKKRKMVF